MSSSDEPIFMETDTGWGTGNFVAPGAHYYVGAIPESEISQEMPVLYMDWQVALTLQSEGQRSIATDKEVAGILLGTCSADHETIKVTHIAIARDEDSSPVHFKFTFSVWDDLIDQMEAMSREAGEELLLLGWYHTHPNMAVFLSRYDLLTHRDFHRPYQFALVLAPRVGTEDTSVGFFVNRDGGTPLLAGVRLFGAIPRREVSGRLPWRFQVLEAEGVEEGEAVAAASASQAAIPVVEHEVQQIGVVRREAAEWLQLGEDVNEGPVLPILEQMAARVVETGEDQMGVFLGTQDAQNHVVVTRVRFIGAHRASTQKEEAELLVALGYMARTFPASGEEKIVGLVRVVAPQQFKVGDVYDPLAHNIRLPLLLARLGYDLDKVPFQVGLVLYPGIEEETFLFQVFAQHKSSQPIPLTSLQAIAPSEMLANERYEPISEPTFVIEIEPCLKAPEVLISGRKSRRDEHIIHTGEQLDAVSSYSVPDGAALTGPINWDDVESETQVGATKTSGLPLVVVLMSVLLFLVAVLLFVQLADPFAPPEESAEPAAMLLDADLVPQGNPYEYTIVGCGEGWSSAELCAPVFLEGMEERIEFLQLTTLEFFTDHTIESPVAWWVPEEGSGRPRVRLEARGEGRNFSFSMPRSHGGWEAFWGDGTPFSVSLVMAPHGAELLTSDELTYLRRSVQIEISGARLLQARPAGELAEGEQAAAVSPSGAEVVAADAVGDVWVWHRVGGQHAVGFHLGRKAFAEPLTVSGGQYASGAWQLDFLDPSGTRLHGVQVAGLSFVDGKVDLGLKLRELVMNAAVVEVLKASGDSMEGFSIRVLPPGQNPAAPLILELNFSGSISTGSVRHRVCIMLRGEDGSAQDGQARLSSQGEMRPTFSPDKGGKPECADGGNSGRWTEAAFEPGGTELRFVYLGSAPEAAAARGREQPYPIPPTWASKPASCIAITVHLGVDGWQMKPPSFDALYALVDGRCK